MYFILFVVIIIFWLVCVASRGLLGGRGIFRQPGVGRALAAYGCAKEELGQKNYCY